MSDELSEKRTVLLSRNEQLELIQDEEGDERGETVEEGGDKKAELIEDIMTLNEDIEETDECVNRQRKNIQKLSKCYCSNNKLIN